VEPPCGAGALARVLAFPIWEICAENVHPSQTWILFCRENVDVAEKNQLYYGDNLAVLREHIRDESVDLIYLDPPFNSRQDYNVLFAERDGARSASQIMAFEDNWEWNRDAERTYLEIVERGGVSPTPFALSAPSSATPT
jgi:16S rRNA G966 N2-methylase RsmD